MTAGRASSAVGRRDMRPIIAIAALLWAVAYALALKVYHSERLAISA